jgi:hypothetical protein
MSKYGYFANPLTGDPLGEDETIVDCKHHPTKRLYTLNKPVVFVDPSENIWVVPARYTFNGASVPRWLWWLCPPDEPRVFAATALHDYHTEHKIINFKKAALVFHLAMRAKGYYRVGAYRNWLGVRFMGPRFQAKGTE